MRRSLGSYQIEMKPDFKSYTYQQLLDSFQNVNRQKYPDRFQEILSEIKAKKPANVRIIKVDSGYRVLEEGKIPEKLGSNHSVKSFSFKTGSEKFSSNFWKANLGLIPGLIVLSTYIWIADWAYKKEIIIGQAIIVLLSIPAEYMLRRLEEDEITYTFYDTFIEEQRGNDTDKYFLNELRDIKIQEATDRHKGTDLVTLEFEKGRKIQFSNFEPHFAEIKSYVINYLTKRLDYELFFTSSNNSL